MDAMITNVRPRLARSFDPQTESRIQREEVMFSYKAIRWTREIDGIESAASWVVPK